MPKYILGYHGGGMPETKEGQDVVMAAWGKWFQDMGPALVDGGNPVGASRTLNGNGSISQGGGVNPLTGYSVIEAGTLDDAVKMAKGCPLLKSGGSIQVGETIEAM
jgi:hypothetical protein